MNSRRDRALLATIGVKSVRLSVTPIRHIIGRGFGLVLLLAWAAAPLPVPLAQSIHAESPAHQQFLQRLVSAAVERTHHYVRYDPAYVRIPYPGGDVPADTGVCTDEVIRSYRAVGVDLQKEVHEDIARDFSAYPRRWQGSPGKPDPNIDHRRVPNLMVFFTRQGESLPITNHADDYSPGDLVSWDLGGGVPHIGIIVDRKSPLTGRYMIVHNIGQGPQMEERAV